LSDSASVNSATNPTTGSVECKRFIHDPAAWETSALDRISLYEKLFATTNEIVIYGAYHSEQLEIWKYSPGTQADIETPVTPAKSEGFKATGPIPANGQIPSQY
jgi:hypothetical protein